MKRRVAALGLLVVLAGLAGCSGVFGPGQPDRASLAENATYDWTNDETVTILVNGSSYEAVYDVTNRTELQVYRRDALGREERVSISALKFRYENGTVVDATALPNVTQTRRRTTIDLPNATDGDPGINGSVAFTAPRGGKEFSTPAFVEGSYAVTLPPNARVGVPLLSQVSPGGYSTSVTDDRVTIHWPDVTSRQVSVRYYLERDLVLFGGLLIIALVVGAGGALYYYRQIRRLARRREAAGIDIDEEDDDPRDRGPPPGMR